MTLGKRLPPVWLMGLGNLPYGLYGAVMLLVVPQLLAGRHASEPQIASVTALALVPGFCGFLIAPILDVRFSRRSYAVGFAALGVVLLVIALTHLDNLALLGALLFAAYFSLVLFTSALSGWLNSIVPQAEESRLAAWINVGNVAGFGFMAIVGTAVLRALPPLMGPIALGAICLAPLLAFPWFPAPGADRRLAEESFGQLAGDLLALVRQGAVLRPLLVFCLPAASFALTNTLGGIGADFGASEQVVSVAGGLGCMIAGVFGALMVPLLSKRFSPLPLYVGIGTVGALFTLSLMILPRTPATFVLAMIGENMFQAAAFVVEFTIMFATMGKNNPFAATHFAVLNAATCLPISYMQLVDGHAHDWKGATGSFLADGAGALAACALVAVLIWRWREGPRRPQRGLRTPSATGGSRDAGRSWPATPT